MYFLFIQENRNYFLFKVITVILYYTNDVYFSQKGIYGIYDLCYITIVLFITLFLNSLSFASSLNIIIMRMKTNLIYTSADENSHRIFRFREQVLSLLLVRDILAVDLERERKGLFQWTMQSLLDFRNESLFSRERCTCIMKRPCSECKSGLETRRNPEYS